MEAGKLRELVAFQFKTESQDSFGAPVEIWTTVFEDYAEYQGLGSREFPLSQKRQVESTARFILRYRDDIDPALHRIQFDDKQWNIAAPIHDLKRTWMVIEASEIA
jgi:SPP1 family predicted phage head-tail adaptor